MIKWLQRLISEYRRQKKLKKRIEELRKMDPFIYD